MKLTAKNGRARKIIATAKRLHNLLYECWNEDDDDALAEAYQVMSRAKDVTMNGDIEIDGWSGGSIMQADTIIGIVYTLRNYDAHLKVINGPDIDYSDPSDEQNEAAGYEEGA